MANKAVAMLGGLIGIIAVLISLLFPLLSWWQFTITKTWLGIGDGATYINAFGYASNTYNTKVTFLGNIFLFGVLIFLAGSILVIITAAKESKAGSIVFSLVMIGGLIIFVYGLTTSEDFKNFLSTLGFLTGEDYTVFFGSVDFGLIGTWTWRLGNGFFIASFGAILALIGSFLIK